MATLASTSGWRKAAICFCSSARPTPGALRSGHWLAQRPSAPESIEEYSRTRGSTARRRAGHGALASQAQTPWYFAAAWRDSNYLKRPESRRIGESFCRIRESFGLAAGGGEAVPNARMSKNPNKNKWHHEISIKEGNPSPVLHPAPVHQPNRAGVCQFCFDAAHSVSSFSGGAIGMGLPLPSWGLPSTGRCPPRVRGDEDNIPQPHKSS